MLRPGCRKTVSINYILFFDHFPVTHSIITGRLGLACIAGRSTAGGSYQQCSREKYREIHDTNEGEILDGVDREAALEAIRQRRGRARSFAAGHGTPRKQMMEGVKERRDISAPVARIRQ